MMDSTLQRVDGQEPHKCSSPMLRTLFELTIISLISLCRSMQRVPSNGISLAYESHGSGHPLILIGGLAYGAWVWHKVVPELAKHVRVIAFDNRGAGESDKPEGPYTAPMMAADTLGLMDALDISSAYVLGISMGGFIAQEIALTQPQRVDKLILAATHYGGLDAIPPPPEAMQVMTDRSGDITELLLRGFRISTAPNFPEQHPEIIQELLEYRLPQPVPPAQYAAQVQVGLRHNASERLSQIQCPTLIVFGEHDNVVPKENAQLLAKKIPHAEIKILPNAGHLLPIESPNVLGQMVIEFLKQEKGAKKGK